MTFTRLSLAAAGWLLLTATPPALACGGFFCEQVPIEQAGEQIVFHQDLETITAMVRIFYEGDAQNFSWVVPVPDTPSRLAIGSDTTFDDLDRVTQPRFALERRGEQCPVDDGAPASAPDDDATTGSANAGGGVTIDQRLAVGPFDTTVISSDNPDDMATWLQDNGYDLSDRGRELIAPYVEMGMKFLAVKLRNGERTQSIRPLVMEYPATRPMVPIRLTAVATQPDLGVLVWIVGPARAVPENYLHVTPNYARLNWYTGPQNAYASYQALISDAMNEVEPTGDTRSGQGFATDYAGLITPDIVDGLSRSRADLASLSEELATLDAISTDAPQFFIAQAVRSDSPNVAGRVATLEASLPLLLGQSSEVYADPQALVETYTFEALTAAQAALREHIRTREIEPLQISLSLLPQDAYLTRLYTTLSADEMSIDPTFGYNPGMPEQPLVREAVLDASCDAEGTQWTLTLGSGTGREGETVIQARQPVPSASVPQPLASQRAAYRQERTSADAHAQFVRGDAIAPVTVAGDGTTSARPGGLVGGGDGDGNGFLGSSGPGTLLALWLSVWLRRRIGAARERNN